MKPGLLTFRSNQVQKLLDYGVPVAINGTEYIQIDKLYKKAPAYRDGRLIDHRLLEVPTTRTSMLKLTSTMSEEEFLHVASTLALSENIKKLKPIPEMLLDAQMMFERFSRQTVKITSYVNADGDEIALSNPVEGRIYKQFGDLPFHISTHEDLSKLGQRLETFDTKWRFSPNEDAKDVPFEGGVDVYGSEHSMFEVQAKPPKIKLVNVENNLALSQP